MGSVARLEAGHVACSNEGCGRPARSQTRPGLCHPCQARACYHRKNPEARQHPFGHHGKWQGVGCSKCEKPASALGLCAFHYSKQRAATVPKPKPEANRARRIKHRYGITLAQYEAMVAQRGGRCDVCGQLPSAENTRAHWGGKLCIDHCHGTGSVRGLLCNNCNLAVGYGKTPDTLERAAEYLRRHTR